MRFSLQETILKKATRTQRKRLLKIAVFLAAIVLFFLVFWFALKIVLKTDYPILLVSNRNMCLAKSSCDGLTHPFEPTLQRGDLVIVQGVNARNVSFAYPNSDILVFHSPKFDAGQSEELVITRVFALEERNGTIYFRTKSDGEGIHIWPEIPDLWECDWWYDYRENYTWNGMISQELLVGKVVFRILWVGNVLFLTQNFGIIVVLFLVLVLIVKLELLRDSKKKAETEPSKSTENASQA
jgi:signal peptidase I